MEKQEKKDLVFFGVPTLIVMAMLVALLVYGIAQDRTDLAALSVILFIVGPLKIAYHYLQKFGGWRQRKMEGRSGGK